MLCNRKCSNDSKKAAFRRPLLSIVGSLIFLCEFASASTAFSLEGTIFAKAGHEYNVDPALLYSIALVESAVEAPGKKGQITPFPWTLRADKPFYGVSKQQAEKELLKLLQTRESVDVGIMQINTKWHGHRVKKLVDLLDPLTNVRVGAQIISEEIARTADAETAIGKYHSYEPERARWYARYVLRVYTQIKLRERQ